MRIRIPNTGKKEPHARPKDANNLGTVVYYQRDLSLQSDVLMYGQMEQARTVHILPHHPISSTPDKTFSNNVFNTIYSARG
jgi:hypothetical protein